jgi:hypothetical protein
MDQDEKLILKPHLIVFADILGTKDRIFEARVDLSKLDQLLQELNRAIEESIYLMEHSADIFRGNLRLISDSILLTIPIPFDQETRKIKDGRAEIAIPLEYIAAFQYTLIINYEFPLRGSVNCGYAFVNELICFGPAIIDVAEKEKEIKNPIICLDNSLIGLLKYYLMHKWPGFGEGRFEYVVQDNDGNFFINYLYHIVEIAEYNADRAEEFFSLEKIHYYYPGLEEELTLHKNLIEKNLKVDRLKQKYQFLADYHNYFCDEYQINNANLLIPIVPKHSFKLLQNEE